MSRRPPAARPAAHPPAPQRALWFAVAFFAALAALLLNRALLPGYTLIPLDIIQDIAPWQNLSLGPRANRLVIDPLFIYYPNRLFLTESLRAGVFPLWNPHLFTGTPTIADPNFQPFYPPNLLAALILPVEHALPWLAFFHLTLTATFMYLFLRRHQLHPLAGALGGAVWLLNGYGLVWLENPHRWSTAAWLPAIFWAYETAVERRSAAWAAGGGLLLGVSILGGQVQFLYVAGLALVLYAGIRWWHDGRRAAPAAAGYLAVLGAIGAGIGALLLLPALEFSAFSHRALDVDGAAVAGVLDRWPAQQLITLLAPDFYGNPATPVRYWGAVNYAEVTAYFGVVALLLALLAPLFWRRSRLARAGVLLLLFTLLVVMGTPLARLLLRLPGGEFLALRRGLVLVPFFGAWLAAVTLDGWLTAPPTGRRRALALGGAVLALGAIAGGVWLALGERVTPHVATAGPALLRAAYWLVPALALLWLMRRWPRPAALLLVALAAADLLQWGIGFNPTISTAYLLPDTALTQRLQADPDRFRVLPLQRDPLIFGPNIVSTFGLDTITGYSSLILADHVRLLQGMDSNIQVDWIAANDNIHVMSQPHPLTGLLNVKYVLAPGPLPESDTWLQFEAEIDGVFVYVNPAAAPRAFVVHQVETVAADDLLPALLNPAFPWREVALLDAPLSADQASRLAGAAVPDAAGTAAIIDYTPNRVTIAVNTAGPGLLVLSDADYPGWRVAVNGEAADIVRAYGFLRAVVVPAGASTVTFAFRPTTLHIGLATMTLALTAAAIIISRRRAT